MNLNLLLRLLGVVAAGMMLPDGLGANTILGSKHDLAAGGAVAIGAVSESEVCLFCHTPHRATGEGALWNHSLSSAGYKPYSSSSLKAVVGQPNGASKLCLSCHDGTVALGMVHSRPAPIAMRNGVTTMPPGPSNLGTDLSDDHPVSFVYDSALAAAQGELKDPATLVAKVRLDHEGQVQCTSCHDPHSDQFGKFLVQDNTGSALCSTCHVPAWWDYASHHTSTKTWNGTGQDPWPHTTAQTVAANGCENCHAPHKAGTPERLMNFANEEENCNACHGGTVATKNVAVEFNKPSVHPITMTSGVHQPGEDIVNPTTRHVECADCHNPHASTTKPALAPNASGALNGVKGVNSSGALVDNVSKEYELCFRCHADSLNNGPAQVNRQFVETNTRVEFSPTSASYHPVVAAGKNGNVPSLMPPWNISSLMYCTDCHNNDQGPNTGASGPNGPHGSAYQPLLERNLLLADYQDENFGQYALCYKCHDRNKVLFGTGAGYSDVAHLHEKHVVGVKAACTTCHDPHGVTGKTHLINFNVNYVQAEGGLMNFNDLGTFSGTCTLNCHGESHVNRPYTDNLVRLRRR